MIKNAMKEITKGEYIFIGKDSMPIEAKTPGRDRKRSIELKLTKASVSKIRQVAIKIMYLKPLNMQWL
jgi:hypothetical protein